MDCSIIIVTYNSSNIIKQCLDSILKNTKNVDFEIIVVDNNSKDETVEIVKNEYKSVICIKQDKNLGFGAANNVGANNAKGDFVLFLNPDTILLNNAIYYFVNYYKENENTKKIGALGAFLLDKNENINTSFSKFPQRLSLLIAIHIRSFLRCLKVNTKKLNVNTIDDIKDIKYVDYIIGADLFMKKDYFQSLGGFDENIFMYSEECELQYRVYKNKSNRILIKEPKIIHLEDQSPKTNMQKELWKAKSTLYFYKKYYPKFYKLYKYEFLLYNKLLDKLEKIKKINNAFSRTEFLEKVRNNDFKE